MPFFLLDRLHYFLNIVDGANGLTGRLTYGQQPPPRIHVHAGDAFGALDAGDEALRAVRLTVEDHVVPAGVENDVVVDVEDRVSHVCFHSDEKSRATHNVLIGSGLSEEGCTGLVIGLALLHMIFFNGRRLE